MSKKAKILAKQEAQEIIKPYQKPCWEPQVTHSSENKNTFHSRYFGNAWLYENEAWPELLGAPALFVMQLDIKTLPEEMSNLLGKEGYLQFFYQTASDYDPEADHLLRIIKPDTEKGRFVEQPEVDYEEDMTQKIITGWVQHMDLPREEDYTWEMEEALEEIDEKHDVYSAELIEQAYQGDKLGGWPFWAQGNETPEDSEGELMIPVYQIDAGCFFDGCKFAAHAPMLFAGDGTGHIYVSKNNPHELKFGWACT